MLPIKERKLLPPEDVDLIFNNVTKLLAYHTNLMTEIGKKVAAWGPRQNIGSVFLKLVYF